MEDVKLMLAEIMHQNRILQAKLDVLAGDLKDVKSENAQLQKRQMFHEQILRRQTYEYYPDSEEHSELVEDHLMSIEDEFSRAITREFLELLREETLKIVRGKEVDLYVWPEHITTGVAIPYDSEVYGVFWRAFVMALGSHKYMLDCYPPEQETQFLFGKVDIPPDTISWLSETMKKLHFRKFTLGKLATFGRPGAKFFLDYMSNNPLLADLTVEKNLISHPDDIHRLCIEIDVHPSLRKLDLYRCFEGLPNSYEILCSVLNSVQRTHVESLKFNRNSVRPGGSTFLRDFITTNERLTCLEIDRNQLVDEDIFLIAEALRFDTVLESMGVGENPFTSAGLLALEGVVFNDKDLNTISSSNHSVRVGVIRPQTIKNNNNFFSNRKTNRAKKIYSALSSYHRHGDQASILGDLPIECFPDFIVAVQECSRYHFDEKYLDRNSDVADPLSIIFVTMKNWSKALSLFEFVKDQPMKEFTCIDEMCP